jgi:hypothetical protein
MATGSQLSEHGRLKKKYDDEVAEVTKQLKQTLPRAVVQLAATLEGSSWNNRDVTQRPGFDPDDPDKSLTVGEARQLEQANLVIDALREYVDLTLRLQNRHGPQVRGNDATPGRV